MPVEARRDPAFERLYRDEFPRLVRGLASEFGPGAADAVQEAFLRAARHWARVSGLDSPPAWIRHVALNLLRNERRIERRRSEIRAALQPRSAASSHEATAELADVVHRLSPQRRLALSLHYVSGYSIDEIAELLDIRAGTVKRYLHEARLQLREMMRDECTQ